MTIPAPPRGHRRGRRHRSGAERHLDGFMGLLGESLRPLSDPLAIRSEAARLLGQHLGAHRVHYADVTPDGSEAVIRGEYCDGVGSVGGRHSLTTYGPSILEAFESGRTVTVHDAVWDPGLTRQERLGALAIGARAYVVTPVIRDAGLAAILAVHHASAREWSPRDVETIRSTAERTWSAADQARSRAALQESEARFRTILDSIDQGYSLVQLAFDRHQRPVDYRIIEVNRSFVRHTGLDDPTGLWAREAFPEIDESCFEAFGKVALTGDPVRFEKHSRRLGRWFEVDAFRVGPAHSRRVGVVFRDVTDRREREANRTFLEQLSLQMAAGSGPASLLAGVGERIAAHFEVPWVGFYQVEQESEAARVLHEHDDRAEALQDSGDSPSTGPSPARRSLTDLLGAALLDELEGGRAVAIGDTRSGGGVEAASDGPSGLRALTWVPHKSDGRLAFLLAVGQPEPRRWSHSEIDLLDELSVRLWSGLERARAGEALRRRERELRELSRSLEVRISERTAELEEQTRRLRRLTAELATAEQRERKRLGSVLHDHLQQLLFAARMHLDRVESRIGADERARAATEDAKRQLADAIEAARDLTRQLRPPALYEAGLGAAIGWLSTEMSRLHGLKVAVDEEAPIPSLSDDLKALVFECIRELLFNVVKHAEVEEASVRIGAANGRMRLAVVDDGKGFEVDPQGPGRSGDGSGLLSVYERLAAIGGDVRIESAPGSGTRVELEVPAD